MRTHLNYFKLFVERDLEIIKEKGVINILIPSSFQTDEGGYGLRNLIVDKYNLLELYSFENRGYKKIIDNKEITVKPFPEVHPQFKFSIVSVKKEHDPDSNFNAKFYLLNPTELHTEPISYSTKMVKNFSPENLSIMEFRTDEDYVLCSKIKGDHHILKDIGVRFRREFNMTDDSKMFQKSKTEDNLVVYEGKMIHQYNPHFESERYYIDEIEGKNNLFEKKVKRLKRNLKISKDNIESFLKGEPVKLDCEDYKLVYRDVGSSTNERTIISTILPQNVFTVNTLTHLINFYYKNKDDKIVQKHIGYNQLIYLMALLNSLILNYYIRNKVSAHVSMFYAYELPIPTATDAQKTAIIHKAFSLLSRNDKTGAFDELGEALHVTPDTETDPIQIRAALEVLIAKELYGLTASDWKYLTSTFVYGSPKSPTKQELDGIIRVSREMFE